MKTMQKKVCPHCNRMLLLRDFYALKNGSLSNWCKECHRQSKKDWYNRNRKRPDGYTYDFATGKTFEKEGYARRIHWSPQMLSDIRRLYPTNTNQDVSEYIGVSVRTLIRKARELGLEKNRTWLHKVWGDNRRLAHFESRRKGYPGGFHERPDTGAPYRFKKGHQMSPEEKEKLVSSLRDFYRRNPIAAKKRSVKQMMAVRCVESGETWRSIGDASRHVGVSRSYLSRCLNGGLPLRGRKYEFVRQKKTGNQQTD